MKLIFREFSFDLSGKTPVMGILNVTPDSFTDGGLFFTKETAVERGLQMVEDGADIMDVGGESTRPGSTSVEFDEELRRTISVIEVLAKRINIPISIDTYKAGIAKRALDAGASMVNDISGLRFDPAMARVVAEYNVPVVIMHIKGTPKNMQINPEYEALIPEIIDYLRVSMGIAMEAGIRENNIIIDPGIGFGKTFEHNLEILNNLREFTLLGKPLLIGPSRKAFIGRILNTASPLERLEGTSAAVAIAIINGANIVRIHDVREMVKVARVADAIKRETIEA
ncbi:MAG TPA: dihydropteroate synthase [Thermodesulfovibrionales bacterium]|nr:dihydropteroate synthase [Thermodesulfovibrionales bacterium]